MLSSILPVVLGLVVSFAVAASGHGTSCTRTLGAGTASASSPFWLQSIKHQGISAYNPTPSSYNVFRNVKDFGAKGDGVTDDTAAINQAISSGSRCGQGTCGSSTITPAVVFFPSGTYVVSSPIIAYYYTQIIGDAKKPPTLLASSKFSGIAVIDADPYLSNGAQWYINQNNMFRSVRNFVIDLRQIPASTSGTGLHWQVSQATSLINIVVTMSTASRNNHQGIYMESGSGGFMGDLVFDGGKYGMWVGNQQFTVRNLTVNNANTAVFGNWDWGWTFQNININNCQVGFDLNTGSGAVGAEAIIDSTVKNTPIFIRTSTTSSSSSPRSLLLNNIKLTNVPIAIGVNGGATVLKGSTESTTIGTWGQGNIYSGTSGAAKFTQGSITAATKPSSLLDGSGKVFGRTHPQYETYAVSQFVSVRDEGAKGDGTTDDTAAITAIFAKYANCKIIFFDAGTYVVSSTITIPSGVKMVGEGWSVIAGKGTAFQDQANPKPVVKVGSVGSSGPVEITDMIFSTIGPAQGAIVVEWNVHESTQGSAGLWDSHIRIGGTAGTNAGVTGCTRTAEPSLDCAAAFMGLHLTPQSSGYFEGTWVWLADHDLDTMTTSEVRYSGRGILSESGGPTWLIGTASEHHTLYEYSLVGAQNHYMGHIQTESPYYQPTPAAPAPFTTNVAYSDPSYGSFQTSAWALFVKKSHDILIYGAGLYSFFQNYDQSCYSSQTCQAQIVDIDTGSQIQIYSLTTVGTTSQLSVSGKAVISSSKNLETTGQQSSFTFWAPSSSSSKRKRALKRHKMQRHPTDI
ncbi:glycoside hydrolase family 55 protein [Piloderma croceum F 1598]|uniref:Glycoside hydrolase family 55 protein n=1 Tax=Piloderma croceum (strain F 1598) TaxID=765440 RepID=A0A0C3F7X6_PILCF|nr:glycoside hydrolase family 55 protein [Piloderma croceum F 1598]